MTKKTEKQGFEDVKKTVKAHGIIDEKEAEKMAEKTEEVTEKLIESENEEAKEEDTLKVIEAVVEGKVEAVPVKIERGMFGIKSREESISGWEPKTKLGREVKNEKIRDIDEILESKRKILEEQIVDKLLNLKTDLILIGQAKGKFGGGKRRAWRQTQKKTMEGNVPTFSTMAVVGDGNGHVGVGDGKAKETLPARDKAIRKAKLNIIKIVRSCSGFDCACNEQHTVPFKVTGKAGSVRVTLIPAPQGTGLVVAGELKKLLRLAGIKDVYSKTFGRRRTTFNLIKACLDALNKTNQKIK
ncbi:MAG: 30S ribosomal protein S5 [Candidatus Pacearchaeota archaeon]|nr:30S ribosomal protein S5 [Candidatus Pacearchaeota archaeon]